MTSADVQVAEEQRAEAGLPPFAPGQALGPRSDDGAPRRAGGRGGRLGFHPAVVVVAGVCAVLVHVAMRAGLSGDVFYEVAAGRWMLAHHAVARNDMLTYTVLGRPWLDEEWGFQWLLAWLVAHVGTVSYWLVSGGACSGAVVLSVARWRKVGAGWLWTGALSVLAGAGMYEGVAPRPQDLSYLFFAALLLVLTLARERLTWLALAPVLLAMWANIHGSFLLGLGVLFLELLWALAPRVPVRLSAERALAPRPVALTLAASLAATLLNPNGPRLISYAFHVSSAPQLTALVTEWQSPDFHSIFLLGVIIGPLLLLVGLLAASETSFAAGEVVLAAVLLIGTLHAVRFMPYLALAMCAVLSRWSPIKKESIGRTLLTVPAAAVACVALLAGQHPAAGAPDREHNSTGTPVTATAYLRQQSGRVFTTYWWDDYLDYVGIPVFVDGRTDLYFGTDILQEYVAVADVTVDPDTVFRQWDVRWVMWDKGDSLAVYLSHDPGWALVYNAGDAVVFERTSPW